MGIERLRRQVDLGTYPAIGLVISSDSTNVLVQGNFIGTDRASTPALGNAVGVFINQNSASNTIGGTAVGAGNVIAGNREGGVKINEAGSVGNRILGNSIFSDGGGLGDGLGIKLAGNDGVTLDEPNDPDLGANNVQNFPVLNTQPTTATAISRPRAP